MDREGKKLMANNSNGRRRFDVAAVLVGFALPAIALAYLLGSVHSKVERTAEDVARHEQVIQTIDVMQRDVAALDSRMSALWTQLARENR